MLIYRLFSRALLITGTLAASVFALLPSMPVAHAQTECGGSYIVVGGDSLSLIASRAYDDTQKWSVIYNVNLGIIGDNPNRIEIGQELRIPCLEDEKAAEAAEPRVTVESNVVTTQENVADDSVIHLLTADDYAPFTDRSLINNGLITDMLVSALSANPEQPQYEVSWVNDWSQHLDPLLTTHEYDVGFPWLRPDCQSTPDNYRCVNFEFSNPIFEMLVLLFIDKSRPITFSSDADIEGAVLCRPKGYYTHDLEKDGRLWLTNNKITLEQPDSIKNCFDLLSDGIVDAVALNEFTGRSAIANLGLEESVEAIESRPLSIEGLHVVIHKSHPRASELLSTINDSMTNFQLSDPYNDVIDTHFRAFWSTIE